MEGPVFRKLKERDLLEVAPRLQVLARSSPEDKKLLVDTLKHLGEVVGVTGDGTNDSPALKSANVGFSMGIAGTEVAKEASDIILMDDNFASIVSAIMWGRCVNDSVKKFLQFQISVNITAVIVTFVTAIASNSESSVLTAVQLLWVNLIMDTFAALALATDPASPDSLKRKPDSKRADLISVDMWKMIVGQSIFQLIAVLVLNFAGHSIFNMGNSPVEAVRVNEENELKTTVFNTFVFCQIFNQLNARVLDRSFNIFAGFWRNYYFMAIFAIMVGGQVRSSSAFQLGSPETDFLCAMPGTDPHHFRRRRRVPGQGDQRPGLGRLDRHRRPLPPYRRHRPTHPYRAHRPRALPVQALPRPERAPDPELRERADRVQPGDRKGQGQPGGVWADPGRAVARFELCRQVEDGHAQEEGHSPWRSHDHGTSSHLLHSTHRDADE